MTTTELTFDLNAAIASGDFLCISAASSKSGIPYWTLWRRLRRERVLTYRLRGRRYVAVSDLSNPALRIP